jgi:hypothetical protein
MFVSDHRLRQCSAGFGLTLAARCPKTRLRCAITNNDDDFSYHSHRLSQFHTTTRALHYLCTLDMNPSAPRNYTTSPYPSRRTTTAPSSRDIS